METFVSLARMFENACQSFPTRTALILGDENLTYSQVRSRVEAWRSDLACVNLHTQERVLVLVDEYVDFICLWFALWQQDCIPIPLEASITSVELERVIIESRAHWLITNQPEFHGLPPVMKTTTSGLQPSWVYGQLDPPKSATQAPGTALFFYTSGTTGTSKCVVFDHAAMSSNILSLVKVLPLTEHDVILTPLSPMLPATLATAVWPALCVGAALVLVPRATPGHILRRISDTKSTVFYAVPYIYNLLSSAINVRRSNVWGGVRLCLTSSAFLDDHVFDSFYELTGLPIRSIYCTSEAGACAYNDSLDVDLLRESIGRPLPGVSIQIVDEQGKPVLQEVEGQLLVQGGNIAKGYFYRPELNKQVFVDGWVYTGDIGMVKRDGYIRLTGRASDTINISGYLVNPREVMQVLLAHPAVSEALVYGSRDAKMGEVVAASIVIREGVVIPRVDELSRFCASRLAHYKVPRHYEFVQELPKGRYGKIKQLPSTPLNEIGGG